MEGQARALRRVKRFLGVDPELPTNASLGRRNTRRFRVQPAGWEVPRAQYEALVNSARRDMVALVALLQRHGLLDERGAATWAGRWDKVWAENLGRCGVGPAAGCRIQLS